MQTRRPSTNYMINNRNTIIDNNNIRHIYFLQTTFISKITVIHRKKFDLYGWISLMSQLIIINRALYVNKQQEGKICAIT